MKQMLTLFSLFYLLLFSFFLRVKSFLQLTGAWRYNQSARGQVWLYPILFLFLFWTMLIYNPSSLLWRVDATAFCQLEMLLMLKEFPNGQLWWFNFPFTTKNAGIGCS